MTQDPDLTWQSRYKLWLNFVQEVEEAFAAGSALETGPSHVPMVAPGVHPPTGARAKIVMCSPHPDDEALVAALPLRLRIETGAEIVNCAITLGSNTHERPRRLAEV